LRTVAYLGPFIMTNFVATGIIRAVGDTRYSLMINLTINLINLILSPILIFGLFGLPRLEVQGAALAVGCAHTIGFFLTFRLLRSRRCKLYLSFKELTTPRWESFRELFKKGLPTTIEQLTWSMGQLVVMSYAGIFSVVVLSVHAIFMRLQNMLSMVYMGFSLAAMSQMGQNLGASQNLLAEKAARTSHRAMGVFVGIVVLLMIVFSKAVIHVFTTDPAIVALGKKAIYIFALAQLPKALNNVLSGNLRGIGALHWLMLTTMASVLLFEVGLNYVLIFIFSSGIFGIWSVQAFDETLRFSLNYAKFSRGAWRHPG
ncbi:MAG: MATE family efflux transporter, partial [Calditrichaeota bacterium]